MHDSERQLQELGVFVHGLLAGLHLLGMAYNLKRRNWVDVACHGGAAVYDIWAVSKHARALQPSASALAAQSDEQYGQFSSAAYGRSQ